jgi:DNA-binding IclR family transcriptional regulator
VTDLLRRQGSASRSEIVRRTGLSRTTVSNLVAELLETGLVVGREAPRAPGADGGRPPVPMALGP